MSKIFDIESHSIFSCKNCGNHYKGNYCNNCGQRSNIQRITLKVVIHDFLHAITHFDKGILFTFKELIFRPGHTIREYIVDGKRIKHANPFLMLIILGGLCSIFYMNLNLRMINSFDLNDIPGELQIIATKSFALTSLAYCFVLSAIDLMLFRYKKLNYMEFFVMNSFITSEVMVAELILIPVWILADFTNTEALLRIIISQLIIAYFVFVRYQFFEAKNDSKVKNRLIMESILFILISTVVLQKTIRALL